MVAIVDSGSTKSDWVILDDFKKVFLKTETIGFNPNFINKELIVPEIEKNTSLIDSEILPESIIKSILPDKVFTLLYRGSKDGFSASTFHTKCNQKGETFIIIKTNSS
mgnify:CR=1 FL=1